MQSNVVMCPADMNVIRGHAVWFLASRLWHELQQPVLLCVGSWNLVDGARANWEYVMSRLNHKPLIMAR